MNGVSNNVAVKQPNYHGTRNGAIAGAAVGGAYVGAGFGGAKLAQYVLKNSNFSQRREMLSNLQKTYTNLGVDMAKTSVSKILEYTVETLKKPSEIAKSVAGVAVVGVAIGLGIDMIKNHKRNKAIAKAEVEQQPKDDKKA